MFDSFFLSLKGISWQKTVCQGDLPWHIPWLWNYGHRHLSFSFVTWLLFATPAAILKSFKFGQRLEFIHFRLILLTCQARRSLHSKRGEKMRIRIQTCVAQWAKIQKNSKNIFFLVSKLFLHFFYLGTKKLCSSPTGLIIEGKIGNLIHNMFASDQKKDKSLSTKKVKNIFAHSFIRLQVPLFSAE